MDVSMLLPFSESRSAGNRPEALYRIQPSLLSQKRISFDNPFPSPAIRTALPYCQDITYGIHFRSTFEHKAMALFFRADQMTQANAGKLIQDLSWRASPARQMGGGSTSRIDKHQSERTNEQHARLRSFGTLPQAV
jgi:hypothetical protein